MGNRFKMSFLLTMMFVIGASSSAFAAVHAGLKSAIDAGDMNKAAAIIKNFNVTDVYCPATLSPADAETLYGTRLQDNPALLKSCDKEFVSAYSLGACSDKSKINVCKTVLTKTPMSQWGQYLMEIKANGLDVAGEGGSNPFANYFTMFIRGNSKKAYALVNYSSADEVTIATVKELSPAGSNDGVLGKLMNMYKEQAFIGDSTIVGSCRLVADIDQQMTSAAGFEVFSCATALERYSPSAIPVCDASAEGSLFTTTPLMEGAPAYNFVCQGGVWKVATQDVAATDAAEEEAVEEAAAETAEGAAAQGDSVAVPQVADSLAMAQTSEKNPDVANEDSTKAAAAKDAAKDAAKGTGSSHSIHWIPIGVSAAALAGGVVMAVLENASAKSASERKIKSVADLEKAKKDADSAQTLRTVGIGIAIAGGVGLGLSIAF